MKLEADQVRVFIDGREVEAVDTIYGLSTVESFARIDSMRIEPVEITIPIEPRPTRRERRAAAKRARRSSR